MGILVLLLKGGDGSLGFVGGGQQSTLEGSVFQTDFVPHDWLFPRMSLVACHGGAGTTWRALWAGAPVVIYHVVNGILADQQWHAEFCERSGWGACLSPLKPTLEECEAALQRALDCRPAVEALSKDIQQEDGSQAAAAVVERVARAEIRRVGCCGLAPPVEQPSSAPKR
mmetsp:Transcript_32335/g.100909  ORF Transcript_32335/g.100909 Transcript_32335/m.100909 type:complete len:170 (-) Transcript_32335:58-567(-)